LQHDIQKCPASNGWNREPSSWSAAARERLSSPHGLDMKIAAEVLLVAPGFHDLKRWPWAMGISVEIWPS